MTVYGQKLKHHRAEAGLSQTQLAEKSGVNVRTIQSFEQGHRSPGLKIAMKLAKALGKQVEEFQRSA